MNFNGEEKIYVNYLQMKKKRKNISDIPCMKLISFWNNMNFHVIVSITHKEKINLVGSFNIHLKCIWA
jgi:hypothetical protein